MATEKQITSWLNTGEKTLERKINTAENDLIKQIWETELKEYQEWRKTIPLKPTK